MNLDEQLRAALDREAEMQQGPAPDVDRLISGGKVRRRRRNLVRFGVAAALAVVLMAVGLEGQRRMSVDPAPADPLPTVQALGSLGRLAYGIDGDIYVADADGRNPVRVADGAPSEEGFCGGFWGEGPIWSPDGRYLAYRGDGGEAIPSTCDRTVNISDSAGRRVASFPGEGWTIAWSPDSTRVAVWVDFYRRRTLAVYGLDGVRQALLAMPPGWSAPGDVDPVWSPDGASLLVPGAAEVPVDCDSVPGGAEVPVDGSTPSCCRWTTRDRICRPGTRPTEPRSPTSPRRGSSLRLPMVPRRACWSPVASRTSRHCRHPSCGRPRAIGSPSSRKQAESRRRRAVRPSSPCSTWRAEAWCRWPIVGGGHGLKSIKFSPEGDEILFTRMEASVSPLSGAFTSTAPTPTDSWPAPVGATGKSAEPQVSCSLTCGFSIRGPRRCFAPSSDRDPTHADANQQACLCI